MIDAIQPATLWTLGPQVWSLVPQPSEYSIGSAYGAFTTARCVSSEHIRRGSTAQSRLFSSTRTARSLSSESLLTRPVAISVIFIDRFRRRSIHRLAADGSEETESRQFLKQQIGFPLLAHASSTRPVPVFGNQNCCYRYSTKSSRSREMVRSRTVAFFRSFVDRAFQDHRGGKSRGRKNCRVLVIACDFGRDMGRKRVLS